MIEENGKQKMEYRGAIMGLYIFGGTVAASFRAAIEFLDYLVSNYSSFLC